MFKSNFQYELRYWLKSPITYIFGVVFFCIALVMMLGTGGFFDGVSSTNKNIRLINSAHEIIFIFQYFNKLLLFMVPVFFGTSLYKDYQSGVYKISYSFPINKWHYLLGKFLCSLMLCFALSLFVAAGLVLGELLLGLGNPKIGGFQLSGYLISYLVFILPNLMIFGGLVFVIVGVSRNIYAAFISVLIFFLFQILIENIFHSSGFLISLLDPFGQDAFQYTTRNWKLSDQNLRAPSILNYIGLNRLFWLSLSTGAFLWFCNKFRFNYDNIWSLDLNLFSKKENVDHLPTKLVATKISKVCYDHSFNAQVRRTIYLAFVDLKYMLRSWMFIVFSIFGMLAVIFILLKITNSGEFNLLPITRVMLSAPLSVYALILMLATFVYAGLLIHRSKMQHMNLLMDVTTTSNWSFLASKILALSILQCCFLFIMLICGIGIQVYNGYYHFEIGQYILLLFGVIFPVLFIWGILSVFIHNLIPNLYIGLFMLVMCWMGFDNLNHLGLDSRLLKFNPMPSLSYDDFNGFANQLSGHFLVGSYWLVFGFIILMLTNILWSRGIDKSIVERIKLLRQRVSQSHFIVMIVLLCSFGLLGFKVYKAEKIDSVSGDASSKIDLADFKHKFKRYGKIVQPKIKDIKLHLNIYPDLQVFDASAKYKLVNRSDRPLDTLLIKTGFDEVTKIIIAASHQLILEDTLMKHYVYTLTDPLPPGDSLLIDFDIMSVPNTLFTRNSSVLKNGSYIKQDILPRLQYTFEDEAVSPLDSLSSTFNFYYKDADNVMLETTITTSSDQIGIAPGDLITESQEGERKRYTYKTKDPIKLNFSFHSGVYKVHTDNSQGVPIEVYTHPNHNANVSSMIAGLKASLDYNTNLFGDYPYDKIRIVEFPHTEESYAATLMSNNIPSSEMLFIINEKAMEDKFNLPFYVMAHELTHEWFGNQLMPAKSLGAKMLTESITEYLSLKIYKGSLGDDLGQKFLAKQHQRYLRGHRKEDNQEQPLSLVRDEQQYIAYGKGAVAFNTMSHYIGEDKMNAILAGFLKIYRNKHEVYPTTLDFVNYMKSNVEPRYQYLIIDLFEQSKLTDVEIRDAVVTEGNKVDIVCDIKKYDANTNENIEVSELDLQIGFLDIDGNILLQLDMKAKSGENRFRLEADPAATHVILDPNRLLLDPDIENNKLALR